MSVTIIVGRNGQGKDMAAVEYGVIPCWRYGRAVAANCSLYPEELGYSADLYLPLNEPLTELPRLGRHTKYLCVNCRQRCHPDAVWCPVCGGQPVEVARRHPDGSLWSITGNRGVGLLLSDITAAFPSRESMGLPPELAQTLQQLRKPDLAPVIITCPAWERVDLLLRECATTVIESSAWTPLGLFRERAETPWGWPRNKAFRRWWFDAAQYEALSGSQYDPPPLRQGLFRTSRITWQPRRIAMVQRAYDSFEDIELADHIACGECGGRLPRSSCKAPLEHREHARALRKQRELEAYPLPELPPATVAELEAPDEDDEREAELIGA